MVLDNLGLAIIGALSAGLFIFLLPTSLQLTVLILVRSAAELGIGAPTGALFPIRTISAVIAISIIGLAIFQRRPSPVTGATPSTILTLVASALAFWTVIGVLHFGLQADLVGESLRVLALVALFSLAYRVGMESGDDELCRLIVVIVGLPAIVLIGGFAAKWGPTLIATGRAEGTFSHPNSAGAFFAVGTIASVWAYWRSRRKSALVVTVLAVVSALLTQSLGGLAGLGAGYVTLIAMNTRLPAGRRIALISLGLSAGVALALTSGVGSRLAEFSNFSYGEGEISGADSLDWRFLNWRRLLEVWSDEAPAFGLGWGSTRFEVTPFSTLPHSVPIQILVETGFVGLSFSLALIAAFASSVRRRLSSQPQSAAALAAIATVIATHGLVSNWLNYVPAQYLAVFTVGAILGLTKPNRSPRRQATDDLHALSSSRRTARQ